MTQVDSAANTLLNLSARMKRINCRRPKKSAITAQMPGIRDTNRLTDWFDQNADEKPTNPATISSRTNPKNKEP